MSLNVVGWGAGGLAVSSSQVHCVHGGNFTAPYIPAVLATFPAPPPPSFPPLSHCSCVFLPSWPTTLPSRDTHRHDATAMGSARRKAPNKTAIFTLMPDYGRMHEHPEWGNMASALSRKCPTTLGVMRPYREEAASGPGA